MKKDEREAYKAQEAEYSDFLESVGDRLVAKEDARRSRALLQNSARNHLFLSSFKDVVTEGFKVARPRLGGYTHKKSKKVTSRVLTALWSDLHFGANLLPAECISKYGPVEEARRMAHIVEQISQYKSQYRDVTRLHINLIGDIIEGNLHDPRFAQEHDIQVGAAFTILRQAIEFLATQFPFVDVTCQVGNHGRRPTRHTSRAVQGKADSYEGGIYQSLRSYFNEKYPNVNIDFGRRGWSEYQLFGEWCFTTHGDVVMNPGNPGSAIDVKRLITNTNNWNASKGGHQYSLFCVGHVHFPAAMYLPNGCAFITNGCLIPSGPYGESLDSPNVSCGQWIWESVEGHILGDQRFIQVNETTDKDKDLDKIIKPFEWQA